MQAILPSARDGGRYRWLAALLATASLALVAWLPVSVRAQVELTVIVPFPAGGSADLAARLFAAHLRERGVQAVTVNQDGGSGVLAFRRMLVAGPRTEILVGPATPMLTGLLTVSETASLRERGQLVCQIYDNRIVLVSKSSPVAEVRSFFEGGGVRVASGGVRSIPYLTLRAATSAAGQQFTHVPFRGEHPALLALAQGEVEAAIVTYSSYLLTGKSLNLSVISGVGAADGKLPQFHAANADVRFPSSPAIVLVQPGAPATLVSLLVSECERFATAQPLSGKLTELGFEPRYRSGLEAAAAIEAASRWLAPAVELR